MLLRLFAMAVLFGGVAGGCVGPRYVALDSGPTDAALPSGTLSLVSPGSLALRPGQTATIDVRFADASGAVASGIVIAAAIEGTALDSTLGGLSVTTDASGIAHASLVAGREASSFRVRLSARGAASPVYVDVGVGTSFGALLVHAPYTGMRPVTHRIVDVVPGTTCNALASMPPMSGGRTVRTATDDVMIATLPTTLTYAVLVRAEGDLATEAIGCTEAVVPTADATTTVNVPLVEVPLGLAGGYTVQVALRTGSTIVGHVHDWTSALRAMVASRGGDAALLLDAVEAELVRAGASADASQLHTLRMTDAVDAALAAQLSADASAPTELVASLLDESGTALGAPTVTFSLMLGSPGMSTMTTQAVACGDGAAGSVSLLPAMPVARTISASTSLDARLTFAGPIDAPTGTLALAWADAVAHERAHVPGVAALMTNACVSLETFAGTTAGANALHACNTTCRASACVSALAGLTSMIQSGMALADRDIERIRIHGTLAAHDDDGDARVDRLEGAITGELLDSTGTAVGPAGAVSGTFSGTRAAVP